MEDIFELMSKLKGKDLYFYLNKESSLSFHYESTKNTINSIDENSLSYLSSSFHHFVDKDRILLSWDIKDLLSYLKNKTQINMEIPCKIYDLRIITSYLNIECEQPERFQDALLLLKKATENPEWKQFSKFYNLVYIPLISRILPEVENSPLIDNSKKRLVYPLYTPEGQINGRMKATVPSENHYNPHTINIEQKENLRPTNYDDVFIYFDYKNMEVNVLQWLSGDEDLGNVLKEEDPYKSIWKKITNQEASDYHRKICKNIFLPVIFGQGAKSLAIKLGIEEKNAYKIIDRLTKTFPVAFDWVKSQTTFSNNMAIDYFGRRRTFRDDELYKIRNFSVQSPASMICLRKLVRLHDNLSNNARICFHVHDGYCVICSKNDVSIVSKIGKQILEEKDELFPEIQLQVTSQYGYNLNQLEKGE